MKFRVMAYDGTLEDFDIESDAQVLFNQKKTQVGKAKIIGNIRPSCNIHKCFHDENPPRPCEIIERMEK